MRKPITPALHGALDYGFLALNVVIPRLLDLPRRTQSLFAGFGVIQGGLNAVTNQPLAVSRLVPFKTHGIAERNGLPLFVGLPLLTGALRDRRALLYFLASGAALVTVYNLTDWDAPLPVSSNGLRDQAHERVATLPGETALGRRDPAAGGGAEDPGRYTADHQGRGGR